MSHRSRQGGNFLSSLSQGLQVSVMGWHNTPRKSMPFISQAREVTNVDETRFDSLARALGAARSRRQLLGAVIGGVAAALFGATRARPTSAGPTQTCLDLEHCNSSTGFCEQSYVG